MFGILPLKKSSAGEGKGQLFAAFVRLQPPARVIHHPKGQPATQSRLSHCPRSHHSLIFCRESVLAMAVDGPLFHVVPFGETNCLLPVTISIA